MPNMTTITISWHIFLQAMSCDSFVSFHRGPCLWLAYRCRKGGDEKYPKAEGERVRWYQIKGLPNSDFEHGSVGSGYITCFFGQFFGAQNLGGETRSYLTIIYNWKLQLFLKHAPMLIAACFCEGGIMVFQRTCQASIIFIKVSTGCNHAMNRVRCVRICFSSYRSTPSNIYTLRQTNIAMDVFPIENGEIPASYVCLPKANSSERTAHDCDTTRDRCLKCGGSLVAKSLQFAFKVWEMISLSNRSCSGSTLVLGGDGEYTVIGTSVLSLWNGLKSQYLKYMYLRYNMYEY